MGSDEAMRRWGGSAFVFLGAILLGGCGLNPGRAPHGPGAARESNLSPWLQEAESVTFTGRLQYFHCTSERGNYYTWSLDPAGAEDAAEVDIRKCLDARHLQNRRVTVTGKLIYREPNHFPLLVAERIVPAASATAPQPELTRSPNENAKYLALLEQ